MSSHVDRGVVVRMRPRRSPPRRFPASRSARPGTAALSRAMPQTLRQSGRLARISKSITSSPRPNTSFTSVPGLYSSWKDQDALVADVGIQSLRHAQFRAGADHALALHAAQLALLDLRRRADARPPGPPAHSWPAAHVGRAADDLQRLFAAHVHRAYVQMVAVGMVLAGEHAGPPPRRPTARRFCPCPPRRCRP